MSTSRVIIDGKILLYIYADVKTLKRVGKYAELPKDAARDWEGLCLRIIDWKITDNVAAITYMTSNSDYGAIHDIKLPVVTVETPIRPPNKSKNWVVNEWSNSWFNKKTGEKVRID